MLQGMGSFVIAVLSGYLFLTKSNYTKYGIRKESGYHVLFRSAYVGVILFVVSVGITNVLSSVEIFGLLESLTRFVPTDHTITLSLTFLLGYVLPFPLNLLRSAEEAAKKVATENGDVIELLINESFSQSLPIHLSLRSGKSYIGYVIESHFNLLNDSDISLFPVASGYRDKDTQKLVITTNYSSIIEEFSVESWERDLYDFRIVIPMSEIVSARYFDRKVYDRFQEYESTDNL